MTEIIKNIYTGITNWFNNKQNVKQIRHEITELKAEQTYERNKIMDMLLLINTNQNETKHNKKDTKELRGRVKNIEKEVISNGKVLVRIETKIENIERSH